MCETHDPTGEPSAGNPPAGFGERRLETEPWRGVRHRHCESRRKRLPPSAYRYRVSRRLYTNLASTLRTRSGKWRAHYAPRLKNRTVLLRRLKELFRRYQSQPVGRVIELINPILRGWVTYFAIGHSTRCFDYVRDWVEKKVRRHMMRARKRKGFGWKRWSRRWLYDTLGLFGHYRVYRPKQLRLKALPV